MERRRRGSPEGFANLETSGSINPVSRPYPHRLSSATRRVCLIAPHLPTQSRTVLPPLINRSRIHHAHSANPRSSFLSIKLIIAAGAIETRSAPAFSRCYPRSFTFYVAPPTRSIETRSAPAFSRCYPRSFTLITRTASCSRQLP